MSVSYVGSTMSAHVGVPAAETASDYALLSVTELGKILSISAIGDTSEDIAFDLLKPGRKTHVNGVKDLGEIAVTIEVANADAGQVIIRDNSNGNTTITFVVSDADGEDIYFQGVVANYQDDERTPNAYKGASFVIRGQTGTIRVVA
jgi:hypothetical protein